MTSRRRFLELLPVAGASLYVACNGGSGLPDAGSPPEGAPDAGSPDAGNPPTDEAVPAHVVVEDWSSGAAIDAGRITFETLVRDDAFMDALLAADCTGWTEHGPASEAELPVLDGVQFSAKRLSIKPGGRYTSPSYRLLVVMRATGLADGLFGDVRAVKTFPRAHKLRVTNQAGATLAMVQMRDGLPINHPSLVNVPYEWTVKSRPAFPAFPEVIFNPARRLPEDKPMRPWMGAGSSYVVFLGEVPESSKAVRDRIPRVRSELWPARNAKYRAVFNGDDVHLYDPNYGGNGNAHPEVMPRWPLSLAEIRAVSSVKKDDPDLASADQGYNWENALRVGWDHEPGALGGITRRGGPGGVRMDRTVLPDELFQMALSEERRRNDGTLTAEMARGHALNQANYPGYYPRSMLTLDAINTFSTERQPNIAGRDVNAVHHYYGGGGTPGPASIWIGDTYGGHGSAIAQAIEWGNPGTGTARTEASHPRNGWCPDSEHANRVGTAWAALLYADPLFARMAEHMMMFETNLMSAVVRKATYTPFNSPARGFIDEPSSFWASRTNILPLCAATMMWWTATREGVYRRAEIEERLLTFFFLWKAQVRDALPAPSAATTAEQRAFGFTGGLQLRWATWPSTDNYAAGSGWLASFGLYSMYLGHFLLLLETSGLGAVLKGEAAAAVVLGDLEKQLEVNARMFADVPWAAAQVNSAPGLLLRSAAAGAVQTDLTTIPLSLAEVVTHNPALRQDEYWFLRPGATPGTDPVSLAGNYATHGRSQSAWLWWDLFAPQGVERTAALAKLKLQIQKLTTYTPTHRDPCYLRFNSPQVVPAL